MAARTAKEQISLEVNDARLRGGQAGYLSIGPRVNNLPVAVSGGEQKRVAVARALANAPSLILADESTPHLDSELGRRVMKLFAKIAQEKNAGVIVVTHDHRTLDLFDRILDVEDGMIKTRSEP